ncbi:MULTISPECIES: transposase [Paenibacillus]|uniref:IS110 family transposase n=1 Tax=Paenibacillus cucumis (ex Kampfer et al. 2016) TaxID=1776858 RepID=A0ABS7KEW2_9BACL|nr:transposase [Paenibacillus cucumis (ex Kampfer et al. 2016)]MBY0202497.1 IS110 family transposase [Paenibacillus cucumis (ex Kampfer et al. 2016)]MDP9701824.1 transposase [Paenibacillus intestini]
MKSTTKFISLDVSKEKISVAILQSLRGIGFLTAVTLVSEIGSFARFASPSKLMAYLGLVPCEHSSGASTKRGSITKTGNWRLHLTLIESAWSYRHRPAIKGDLAIRLEGLSEDVQQISWKAQNRLHAKCRLIFGKHKHPNVAIAAVGRD